MSSVSTPSALDLILGPLRPAPVEIDPREPIIHVHVTTRWDGQPELRQGGTGRVPDALSERFVAAVRRVEAQLQGHKVVLRDVAAATQHELWWSGIAAEVTHDLATTPHHRPTHELPAVTSPRWRWLLRVDDVLAWLMSESVVIVRVRLAPG